MMTNAAPALPAYTRGRNDPWLPTARDRDRLRQFVLEGLGWTLHRVWSTDWWTDPEREMQKLEASLNNRLQRSG